MEGLGLAALLHGLLAGRRQPVRGERAALRLAGARPDPRPAAHDVPADGRREPVRLARQRADGAADQGPAARHRRARRPRRRRGPAPQRDRARTSSTSPSGPTRTPGCCSRCSASLVEERLDRRGGARARDRPAGRACATSRSASRPRRRRPAPASPPTSCGSSRATWPAPTAPRSTGAPGSCLGRFGTLVVVPARRADARDRQPRPRGRRRVRAPGDRARRGRPAGRPRHLRQGALAARRLPRRARRAPRLAARRGDDDARRGPDPRVLHERRQPGAVVPDGAGAGGGARRAGPLRLARLLRQRDEPARRLHPARRTTWLERDDLPIAFLGLPHDPVRAVRRASSSRRAARRARSGRSSTRSRARSACTRTR